jgi:hypothetical protein
VSRRYEKVEARVVFQKSGMEMPGWKDAVRALKTEVGNYRKDGDKWGIVG